MDTVIELQPQDDRASVGRQLGRVADGRVVLVVPWNLRFLSRPLGFELLWREAERRCLDLAVVSVDAEQRHMAAEAGFPVFPTVEQAQASADWADREAEAVEPPPRHWYDPEIELQPQPERPALRWVGWVGLGLRVAIFLLSLVVVAAAAYAIVPSGVVTVVPAGVNLSAVVPISIDPEAEQVDVESHVIPAESVGGWFEGYIEVETTGEMDIYAGRSTGTVEFTNLLAQDYRVPSGTVVRTSSTSYPVRFRTTEDVVVPAGGKASAPIQALEEHGGNVAAFQINQVEGVAASAVRVINPQATTGAEPTEARVVTQADYERAAELLEAQLLEQAYIALSQDHLESTETLLRHSMLVVGVERTYNRFVTEQADTLGLNMRVLVKAWKVDLDNAETVAYADLAGRVPPGYRLRAARFELGEEAEEHVGPGSFAIFVTARGYADAMLDEREVASLARGQRVEEAREQLAGRLPLAEQPQVTLWPEWPQALRFLERLPLIAMRIDVRVVHQVEAAGPVP